VNSDLCPVCGRELEIVGRGWTRGGVYFVTRQCPVRCKASSAVLTGEAKKEREEIIAWIRSGEVRLHRRANMPLRCYLCGEPIELGERYYFSGDTRYGHLLCAESGEAEPGLSEAPP